MLQHIITQAHVPASLFLDKERKRTVLSPQVRTPSSPIFSQASSPDSEDSEGITDVLTRGTRNSRVITSCLALTRLQLTELSRVPQALGSHTGQSSCSDLEVLSHSENS